MNHTRSCLNENLWLWIQNLHKLLNTQQHIAQIMHALQWRENPNAGFAYNYFVIHGEDVDYIL